MALLVIATVYTEHVEVVPLAGRASGSSRCSLALRYVPCLARPPPWSSAWRSGSRCFESGIDPLISGLAIGLRHQRLPAGRADLERVTELTRSFREQPTPELARSAQLGVASAISPNERLQYRLHPWTSFVIVPLFALANAGIHIDGELLARRGQLADHARDRRRLRRRQAGRDRRRRVARDAAVAAAGCARRSAGR